MYPTEYRNGCLFICFFHLHHHEVHIHKGYQNLKKVVTAMGKHIKIVVCSPKNWPMLQFDNFAASDLTITLQPTPRPHN